MAKLPAGFIYQYTINIIKLLFPSDEVSSSGKYDKGYKYYYYFHKTMFFLYIAFTYISYTGIFYICFLCFFCVYIASQFKRQVT